MLQSHDLPCNTLDSLQSLAQRPAAQECLWGLAGALSCWVDAVVVILPKGRGVGGREGGGHDVAVERAEDRGQ